MATLRACPVTATLRGAALDARALEAAAGDRDAVADVLEAIDPLLWKWARASARRWGIDAEEAHGDAVLTAVGALRRYDGRGAAITYLGTSAALRLRRTAQELRATVHVPAYLHTSGERQHELRDDYYYAAMRPPVSLHRAIRGGDQNVRLADILPAPADGAPAAVEARDSVRVLLRRLPWRERRIIERRYGLGSRRQPCTLEQCGDEIGVSRERARQIEARAMARLRGG